MTATTRILAMLGELVVGGGVPLSSVVLLGLLGAATTVAIVALARVVLAALVDTAGHEPPVVAKRADLAGLVAQSDPDADGHVRARAPGQGGRVPFPALAAAVPPIS